MRYHDSKKVAGKIISDYSQDITRLESLKAQGKLNASELQELERIRKAKALVARVLSCI